MGFLKLKMVMKKCLKNTEDEADSDAEDGDDEEEEHDHDVCHEDALRPSVKMEKSVYILGTRMYRGVVSVVNSDVLPRRLPLLLRPGLFLLRDSRSGSRRTVLKFPSCNNASVVCKRIITRGNGLQL